MNKKELVLIKNLFKQFSKEIGGTFLCYDEYPTDLCVVKEDFLLRFQEGVTKGRYSTKETVSHFRLIMPLDLLDTMISIRSNALRFFTSVELDEYYFTEVKDYVVKVKKDSKTIALTEALINDYYFKDLLNRNINRWRLKYQENMLSAVGFFDIRENEACEELLKAYYLLIEFKKALEYHSKKIV